MIVPKAMLMLDWNPNPKAKTFIGTESEISATEEERKSNVMSRERPKRGTLPPAQEVSLKSLFYLQRTIEPNAKDSDFFIFYFLRLLLFLPSNKLQMLYIQFGWFCGLWFIIPILWMNWTRDLILHLALTRIGGVVWAWSMRKWSDRKYLTLTFWAYDHCVCGFV